MRREQRLARRACGVPEQPACGQDEPYERALAAPSRSCGGLPSACASTRSPHSFNRGNAGLARTCGPDPVVRPDPRLLRSAVPLGRPIAELRPQVAAPVSGAIRTLRVEAERAARYRPQHGADRRARPVVRRLAHLSERVGACPATCPAAGCPVAPDAGRVGGVTAPTATDPLALDLEATTNALATGIRDAVRRARPARRRARRLRRRRLRRLRRARRARIRTEARPAPPHARARHRPGRVRPRPRAGGEPRRAAARGVDLGRARGPRLLPPPRRGDPGGLPGVRGALEAQGRALGTGRRRSSSRS